MLAYAGAGTVILNISEESVYARVTGPLCDSGVRQPRTAISQREQSKRKGKRRPLLTRKSGPVGEAA